MFYFICFKFKFFFQDHFLHEDSWPSATHLGEAIQGPLPDITPFLDIISVYISSILWSQGKPLLYKTKIQFWFLDQLLEEMFSTLSGVASASISKFTQQYISR